MIEVNIQQIAQKRKIKNAYQLQKLTGFTPSTAARIYKGKWKRLDLTTLDTLCNFLKCKPNDILKFTPDPEEN